MNGHTMNQLTPAGGLDQALSGIVISRGDSRKAIAVAMDCLALLEPVASAFKEAIENRPQEFGRVQLTGQLAAVETACDALASALKAMHPETLSLISLVSESRQFVENELEQELKHWEAGGAGEFFPIQDYGVEGPWDLGFQELVPLKTDPSSAPMVQRLGHIAVLMRFLQRQVPFFRDLVQTKDNRFIGRPKNMEPELDLLVQCGWVLLKRGHGLNYLKPIAEAIFTWSQGHPPPHEWQKRGLSKARKHLLERLNEPEIDEVPF